MYSARVIGPPLIIIFMRIWSSRDDFAPCGLREIGPLEGKIRLEPRSDDAWHKAEEERLLY